MNIRPAFASALAAAAVLSTAPAHALTTASIGGAFVTSVQHDSSTTRGPNGRAFVFIDRHFNPAGVCTWAGAVDAPSGWALEFDAEKASFNAMYALVLEAKALGAIVRIDYDDGFGAGTTCRITNISIE